jgi:hypothetical protein
METNLKINMNSWIEKFENYLQNLSSHRKTKGFKFFLFFLHDFLLFILLSIVFYLIKLLLITYQVN